VNLPTALRAVAVTIPGGQFTIGSDEHYPEERPARTVSATPFRLARTPITNADFAEFVAETGWVTMAERTGSSDVFVMTRHPVPLTAPDQWWANTPGACWRHPEGPTSSILGREAHPVTHVCQADAQAFADWAEARLPTELEWEVAARGGLAACVYAWGNEFTPDGTLHANIWTGSFPWYFSRDHGPGTNAVGAYPPNGFGLSDMIGNVWEWTDSLFSHDAKCDCAAGQSAPDINVALKGGSFLCAGEYCLRYRPAARIGVKPGATTSHIGFRCAWDV
jgi:formylglycine-generating enzyme